MKKVLKPFQDRFLHILIGSIIKKGKKILIIEKDMPKHIF